MKKKKFNWRFYIGFVFIALVVIGIVGLIVINQEPHLKITKEECRNETYYESNSKNVEVSIKSSNFYSLEDLGFLAFTKIKDEFDNPILTNQGIARIVGINDTHKTYIIWIKIYSKIIKEVCESVIVDEWFFICNNSDYYGRPPTDCELKEYEFPIKTFWGNYDEGNNVITIENMEIEWLDENCECVEVYDKDKKEKILCGENEKHLCRAFTNRPKHFECSKYKWGEYFVEIER